MTKLRASSIPELASSPTPAQESGTAQVQRLRTASEPEPANDGPLPKRCVQCGGRYPADFRVCPRDAIPLEDAPEGDDPMLGTTLADSYEIIRVIGEGGMGRVYEARHTRLASKRYAVKLLHQELARKPEVMTRFQREAEAVSALSHPNVVGVFDVNHTADARPYIVQELLQGEEFGCLLDRVGKISPALAAYVVRRVCRALIAAHAQGIVHRDMKPENVFLVGSNLAPSVKVLDFGISKVAESTHNLTQTGVVMGTPAYMAPEQARGDRVDERADVYSVGAILYRAVTGHKPFEGLEPMATLTAVIVEEPPRPCVLEPGLPAALELVIQRAMAKKPQERYQSMAELEADLETFDSGIAGETLALGRVVAGRPDSVVSITSPDAKSTDVTARTVLARGGTISTSGVASVTRQAKLARPALALWTLLGFVCLFGGLVDASAAAIRMTGDGKTSLSSAEVALTTIGVLAALLTPTVLWIRHLKRQVWTSSPRAIETAARLRRTLLVALAAYGSASLVIHLLESIVRKDASGIAWSGWTIASFLVAASVVAASWFGPSLLRRDR